MANNMETVKELHDKHLKLGQNDLILDVRNPDEFQAARIQGAQNIPLPEVLNHAEKLKQYDHVYIHCKKGGRAKTAFDALKNAGLSNLICIYDGGMDMWIENGYPVIQG